MSIRADRGRARGWATAAALGLAGAGGCGPHAAPPAPRAEVPEAKAAPRRDGVERYTLRGVVQAVDAAAGEVTIAHEAMPGFMGAMTMPFTVQDRKSLDDVQPGDVVTGPMVVEFRDGRVKDYELTGLTPTGLTAPTRSSRAAEAGSSAPRGPLKVGDVVPDFAVTTQDGATLRLSDLRGKVVALTFIYTRCPLPDFCPAVDGKFAELNRRVAAVPDRAERVRLLSISFDPAHDTPEVLRKHAAIRGAKAPWSFAVASPEELARVGPLLGLDYYPERDQFAHNLTAAVIDPEGRLARLEIGRNWGSADLLKAIAALLPPRG